VLGINPISDPAEGYYLDAVAQGVDEYYRGVGEAPGWWAGTAAAFELGLDGEVNADDLIAVWSGLDPRNGEQLGPFTNRKVRGFDLCWRAPKSVSLLFAFGSPEVSKVVRDAHDRAVAAAFGYLEANAAATRKGHGGLQSEPVDGFVASMFRHRTSRTGDPHLHTHVLIANVAKAADGKWRTLDGRLLYTHHKTAGHLYQAHLRHELTWQLGVEWGPVKNGCADIEGIDRTVIEGFSERRRQILEHMDRTGFRTARAAQIATLETRPDKTTPTEGTIRDVWTAKAAEIGFDPTGLGDVIGRPGDEIVCLRNDYRLGVRNGDRAVVERVDAERSTMRVQFDDGVRVLPTEYLDAGHVAHAYATTIHRAQGMTVDRCLTLGTDDLYREAGYVALSRGRTANVLYAVGGRGVDEDLTHVPQRDASDPVDLVRDAFGRQAGKQLAIEKAVPDHDWGIGATERRLLLAEIEALDGALPPARDDDFGIGLGL